jgi:hypothetical protein
MHKTRQFLPPIPSLAPGSYDLYSPRLRLVALPRTSLHITGDFEALTRPVLEAAKRNAGKALDVPEDHIVVPVHELQVSHIHNKFEEATIYPDEFSLPVRAQQSIRYVFFFAFVLVITVSGTSALQVCRPSRGPANNPPQTRSWHQTDVRGPHNFARERLSWSTILRTRRPGLAL